MKPITENSKKIINEEFEQAIKRVENTPQPEWVTHYNRYESHKEDYPLTVSEILHSVEYSLPIYLKIAVTCPIKGKEATEKEQIANKAKFFGKFHKSLEKPLADFLDPLNEYHDHDKERHHGTHLKEKILQTRVSTCLGCGEKQEIELFPLAVDRDFWICKKCGKTHAHARPGWSEPIT